MILGKKNKIINNCEPAKLYFLLLVLVFIISIFSYGYLVRGVMVNIVSRQNMETEIVSLSSRVLDLESLYIKARNNVTQDLARDLGFVTIKKQKFVTRNITDPGISLLTQDN